MSYTFDQILSLRGTAPPPSGQIQLWPLDLRVDPDAHPRASADLAKRAATHLLALHTGMKPESVVLETSKHGKPHLPGTDLRFNISHSGEFGIVAISRGFEIGVDTELLRPRANVIRLARRFFAPEEVDRVERASAEEQLAVFYRIWTRKEAFLKAIGIGIRLKLSCFAVSADPGCRSALERCDIDEYAREAWRVADLKMGDGVFAAVAAKGEDWEPKVMSPDL
mgnify:CR=1 FL=1